MSLERVKEVGEAALRAMGTMGVALSGCTLPGAAPSDRRALLGPYADHTPRRSVLVRDSVACSWAGGT